MNAEQNSRLKHLENKYEEIVSEYALQLKGARMPQIIATDAEMLRVEALGLEAELDVEGILSGSKTDKSLPSVYIGYLIRALDALMRAAQANTIEPVEDKETMLSLADKEYREAKIAVRRGPHALPSALKSTGCGSAVAILITLGLTTSLLMMVAF